MIERVFVTGIGAVSPVGLNAVDSWSSLKKGESGIGPITSFDADGFETTFAAEIPSFDPESHVSKKQARRMDRFVQFGAAAALEAAVNALRTGIRGSEDTNRKLKEKNGELEAELEKSAKCF